MATLTSNDEQVVCGEQAAEEVEEGDDDIVANQKNFFQEPLALRSSSMYIVYVCIRHDHHSIHNILYLALRS